MTVKQENNVRVWRATLDSTAGILLSPRSITLAGDQDNFISLNERGVTVVSGNFNIATDPMNISKGLLFKEQLGFLQLLPSNMVMPVANTMMNLPGTGMAKSLKKPLSVVAVQAGGSFGGAGASGSF